MKRTSRAVFGGAVVGALLLGGTAVAAAQGEPSGSPSGSSDPSAPVTITLPQEQVTWLCDKRLPKVEKRVTRLVERITGDADTRGSAEWLRAKAKRERDAGRETTAQLLEERADRRAGRVDQLNQIKQWASDFRADYCGAK